MVRWKLLLAAGVAASVALLFTTSTPATAAELVVRNDSRHHIIVHVQPQSRWRDDDDREWHRRHWRELGSVRGHDSESFHVEHGRYRIAARDRHGRYWPPKEIYIRRGERFTFTFYVD